MGERVEVLREELRVRLDADDVRVRLATSADAAAWSRAATSMFRDTFGPANKPEDLEAYLASAFSEEQQRAEISEANSRIWLAYDREGIAGYAHVRLGAPLPAGSTLATNRSAEIARIYAERRWQGRGLGASLMRVCVATVSEWGADVLWLGVWKRNPRAIAFYEKQGFVAVGEQAFLLGADLQHDFVMARRLTNEH
ncbi:MAG TPA: GNAT family N-acetyltransferase [Gemmatimonadaceae bacterium]|nr:GNAT family N-acetyltransferase [Gemmatimonadaceae bacterium]